MFSFVLGPKLTDPQSLLIFNPGSRPQDQVNRNGDRKGSQSSTSMPSLTPELSVVVSQITTKPSPASLAGGQGFPEGEWKYEMACLSHAFLFFSFMFEEQKILKIQS